jgi:NADPH-dependent 2,4-dienoyl-CoA reductase/sulfur reductase-like enzyme
MAWSRQVTFLARHSVVAGDGHSLLVETPVEARQIHYRSLVLATGARELSLPFPGWTLPGVTGAGGLQALAKQGWPVAGKRIVVAGSGPLLLAAASSLRAHGAHVLGICEQASPAMVNAFALQLLRWPGRAMQAAGLRGRLAGVPYRRGTFVQAAHGEQSLHAVDIVDAAGTRRIECDHLAVGYGLVPNTELAGLLGCALERAGAHLRVLVDDRQRSSVADIYAAGESCGIGGLGAARIEGAIAGHAAAGSDRDAHALSGRRTRERRFAALLDRYFALDPRLFELATPQTLICRCEDVSLEALDDFTDARDAKLATRCGMGACQGRICGSALAALGRFRSGVHRPPLFPARLATLALAQAESSLPDAYPR